jgi:microcystin-dependent protein
MAAPSGATPVHGYPYPIPDDDVDVPRDIKALADALEAKGFIVGEVRHIAIPAAPAGWLLADGRAVSRATYDLLYAAIAVTFGSGDGSTTFNLPDIQGRVLVGTGTGSGLSARAIGTKWGVEAVVLDVTKIPSHNHGGATAAAVPPDHTHSKPFEPGLGYVNAVQGSFAEMVLAAGASLSIRYDSAITGAVNGGANQLSHAHGIPAQGGGGGHDNTQPSLAIPAYIYAGE